MRKVIEGFPDYEVDEHGNVWSNKSIKHAARLSGISPSSIDNLKAGKRSSVNGWSLV